MSYPNKIQAHRHIFAAGSDVITLDRIRTPTGEIITDPKQVCEEVGNQYSTQRPYKVSILDTKTPQLSP